MILPPMVPIAIWLFRVVHPGALPKGFKNMCLSYLLPKRIIFVLKFSSFWIVATEPCTTQPRGSLAFLKVSRAGCLGLRDVAKMHFWSCKPSEKRTEHVDLCCGFVCCTHLLCSVPQRFALMVEDLCLLVIPDSPSSLGLVLFQPLLQILKTSKYSPKNTSKDFTGCHSSDGWRWCATLSNPPPLQLRSCSLR